MRVGSAILVALLAGCMTPEQRAANQHQAAQGQQAALNAAAANIMQRCQAFGFQPNTDGFANCVATEVRSIEGRMQASACQQAQQEAHYWCSGPGRQQSVLAGYNCPQAAQRVRQHC